MILFDCMETLIDMVEIPGEREYALWALEGSGAESYWSDKGEFIKQFHESRRIFKEKIPYDREYSLSERFQLVIEMHLGKDADKEGIEIVDKLVDNFWSTYRQKCYVSQEVKETLKILGEKYKMGVVSNFLIQGGIEELIKDHGIEEFFKFIVTSVSIGWRKPHPEIYQAALRKLDYPQKQDVLFIGDDYQRDYLAPCRLGMNAILYDKNNKYPHIVQRFTSFSHLTEEVNQIFRI